ncbi:MAG: hypothetical protein ACRDLF_13515 [Solirubrobacteraceae bacterium]
MEGRITHLRSTVRLPARARLLAVDRVNVALGVVFVLGAVFYLWTAGTSYPLALNSSKVDPYNQLATAFLHLHLSVGRPPAGLLKLSEPYDPVANSPFQLKPKLIHDFALYHGKLFLTWGPAPVVVLLVPLHLLGLEPSTSLTAALFAIAGLAFALAALRVVLRQLGNRTLWMCTLAAFTLALSSVLPFTLRRPEVYEEAITGGFCFAMAGIWLALSALVDRRASPRRLVLMSLCFGLAAGSRPTLGLTALVLVPVYLSLRRTRPLRALRVALLAPFGGCLLLLAAYNQARFGNPLEVGTKYALAGINQHAAHFGALSYVWPGAWYYLLSPPRPSVLFPFLQLAPPPVSYPATLPANYEAFELTGGLLPMAPFLVFLAALPWLWRRRPKLLGALGVPLLLLAGAGAAILLFLSYEFFATTERYEVDFATLLLLGALTAWLALSGDLRGARRWVVRIGGALLATWGCLTGLAISFTGYANLLAVNHQPVWEKLESVTSPLSEAIAAVSGGPVLAEVNATKIFQAAPVSYTSIESPVKAFGLSPGEPAGLTIVSPNTREAALVVRVVPGVAAGSGATPSGTAAGLLVRGPGSASVTYTIPPSGEQMRIPVRLAGGTNRLTLTSLGAPAGTKSKVPVSREVLVIASLSLSGHA